MIDLEEARAEAARWHLQRKRTDLAMSIDAYTLDWLHRHRQDQGEFISTLGRRWLTRAIWHQEERVENDLRLKR